MEIILKNRAAYLKSTIIKKIQSDILAKTRNKSAFSKNSKQVARNSFKNYIIYSYTFILPITSPDRWVDRGFIFDYKSGAIGGTFIAD